MCICTLAEPARAGEAQSVPIPGAAGPLPVLFWSKASVDGKVIDAASGQPVPRAVVLANWKAISPGVTAGSRVCLHVDAAVADERGTFQMKDWEGFGSRLRDQRRTLDAYKFGYEVAEVRDNVILMRRLPADVDHWRVAQPCVVDQDDERHSSFRGTRPHLYWLYSALVEDLTPLATTQARQEVLVHLRAVAESCLVDYTKPIRKDRFRLDTNVDPADRLQPPAISTGP